MRFLWRELSVEVRLIFILRFPSVCRAGLSQADRNQPSLPGPSLLALSYCQAALTPLTPPESEFRLPGCAPVGFVTFWHLCHVTDRAGALHTLLFGLRPHARFAAQRCELSSASQMDRQDLWPAAGAPYVAPAAALHHSQSPCQRSPVLFLQRTPET